MSTTGTPQYAHGDGLGSLRLVTDASGAAAGSATYEPWGAPRTGSATLGGYGFTGELTDAETGFVYLRARYLDPATGRFLSEDSYAGTPGSPMSQHRFAYGNDNPLSYTDPSGHFVIGAGAAVVWAFAAVGITVTAPVAAAIAAVIGVTILIQCFRMGPCLGWVKALAAQVSAGFLSACGFAGALHAQWQQGWASIGTGSQVSQSQQGGSQGGQGQAGGAPKPQGSLRNPSGKRWHDLGINPEAVKEGMYGPGAGSLLDLYLDDEGNIWVMRKRGRPEDAELAGSVDDVRVWAPYTPPDDDERGRERRRDSRR